MDNRTVLMLLVSVGVAAAPARAQDDRAAEVHRGNNCRLAAQVLTTGHPHPHREWAQAVIVDCEGEGPAYFAARWENVDPDTAALRVLIAGSTRLRDSRIYNRVYEVASDRSRPSAVRAAAMIVLAAYVDATVSVDLTELRVPEGPLSRIRLVGGSAVDVVQVDGSERLGPVRSEVIALLNRIGSDRSAEPREVWYAAAALARRID